MPFIVISLGGEEISRHALVGPTVVGRAADAEVSVRDASLSRWHCRFEPAGDPPNVWAVTDLGSRNGTTLNGRRVTRHVLHHGDLLRVGRVTVFYSTGAFVSAAADSAPGAPGVGPASSHKGAVGGGVGGSVVRPLAPPDSGGHNGEDGIAGSSPTGKPPGRFAKPLLVPADRLPRPVPGARGESKRPSPADLELLSSPGWSRHFGKQPPSPSVDFSPGEFAPSDKTKTLDLSHPPTPKPRTHSGRSTPLEAQVSEGLWGRFKRGLTWLFRR